MGGLHDKQQRDDRLWYEEPAQNAVRLRSLGRGAFVFDNERGARVTFDIEGDRAAWFTLARGGTSSRAQRMD